MKAKLIILVSCFLWLVAFSSQAAQLNLISQTQEIGINQQFQVDLILDTENEEINAVEGKIIFPSELLELKEIKDGNSIISFWVERPNERQAISDKQQGEIHFSGIVPGGYVGENGWILSMIFQARAEGAGIIEISDAAALLNDGKGTSAQLSIINYQLSISEKILVPQIPIPEIKDADPPEEFKPEIAQSPEMFDGKWFIVFATQDKGSGIAYYAIRETRREIKRETDAKWIEAESPYVLKDQKLRSYVYVKAVDKAGNERIAMISPKYPLRWYEKYENWIIIIIVVILAAIFFRILWRIYTKIHKHQHEITRNF